MNINYLVAAARMCAQLCCNSGDTYAKHRQSISNGKTLPQQYNYDDVSPRANFLLIRSNVPIIYAAQARRLLVIKPRARRAEYYYY